jgi:hypothetical protein
VDFSSQEIRSHIAEKIFQIGKRFTIILAANGSMKNMAFYPIEKIRLAITGEHL